MQTTARFSFSGRIITMRILTVQEMEAIASEYSAEALNAGRGNRFGRDLIAASISHINDIPIDPERFDARKEFPLSKDWNFLEKAYAKLNGLDRLPSTSDNIIILFSGRRVILTPLTVDQDESLELKNRYGAADWLRRKHDRIAASISNIDGNPIDPTVCDLRVEIPLANDWILLRTALDKIELSDEVADFLPNTPG